MQSDISVNAQRHHLGQNLVCGRRNISDNLTFLSMPSATWKPEIRAILWQHLPFFLFLGRRILDKKLMDHAI